VQRAQHGVIVHRQQGSRRDAVEPHRTPFTAGQSGQTNTCRHYARLVLDQLTSDRATTDLGEVTR
jgi:hypothetical protein